jgi:hypothetical protein
MPVVVGTIVAIVVAVCGACLVYIAVKVMNFIRKTWWQ